MDTTTCIGCKACEVACLEWNGYTFTETTFDNTYQTMPETAWNYWNLIKFNEHERADGSMMLLMRKDQCMHCADPGCLAACPADAAIVQYANGIVDFQEANCIGCGYCMTGCPFNIPKFDPPSRKVFKCTLCNDRVSVGLEPACIKACPTGCLHFGTKSEMKELAETRAEQLRDKFRIPGCGSLRSGWSGRNARDLRPARCQESRVVWRACRRIRTSRWSVRLWKGPLKWLGNLAMVGGIVGMALHYMRFGPKKVEPIPPSAQSRPRREARMTTDAVSRPSAANQNEETIVRVHALASA